MRVTIWDSDDVPALMVSPEADRWFTRVLGKRLPTGVYARNDPPRR